MEGMGAFPSDFKEKEKKKITEVFSGEIENLTDYHVGAKNVGGVGCTNLSVGWINIGPYHFWVDARLSEIFGLNENFRPTWVFLPEKLKLRH